MSKDIISQTDFNERITEWKKMERTTDNERKKASEFYDREIFPTVIDVFVRRHKPEKDMMD